MNHMDDGAGGGDREDGKERERDRRKSRARFNGAAVEMHEVIGD